MGQPTSLLQLIFSQKEEELQSLGLFKLLFYEKISSLQVLPTSRSSPGQKVKPGGAGDFLGNLLNCSGTSYWRSHLIVSFFLRAIDLPSHFTGEKAVAWVGKLLVKDAMSSYERETASCLDLPRTARTSILMHMWMFSNGQSCPTMDWSSLQGNELPVTLSSQMVLELLLPRTLCRAVLL